MLFNLTINDVSPVFIPDKDIILTLAENRLKSPWCYHICKTGSTLWERILLHKQRILVLERWRLKLYVLLMFCAEKYHLHFSLFCYINFFFIVVWYRKILECMTTLTGIIATLFYCDALANVNIFVL